ncbi:hypothetical protein ACIBF5_22370 [Micromonospora sp. NPDC050417]|uniref:hypothetical protein n=1 Tax=Micromonospora sp. NPDC050417 TaxID=3364280 RepID=UPI0037BBD45A
MTSVSLAAAPAHDDIVDVGRTVLRFRGTLNREHEVPIGQISAKDPYVGTYLGGATPGVATRTDTARNSRTRKIRSKL